MAELNDLVTAIETRQELVGFFGALRHDLAADPADWENLSLDQDLDALGAWLEGPDESFAQFGEPVSLPPSCRFAGKLLWAAKYYE